MLKKGNLSFQVTNEGSVRFLVHDVKVRGVGPENATLFERQAEGWYVLAGTHRDYEIELPADVCPSLRHIEISTQTDSNAEAAATATTRIEVKQSDCK